MDGPLYGGLYAVSFLFQSLVKVELFLYGKILIITTISLIQHSFVD